MIRRHLFCAIGLATLLAAGAHAADYPTKPVTMVVPFPPGGSTDTIARTLAAKLQERLGQPFVVENKAGATGTIGAAQVKRSPADGYTLFVSSLGPFVIAPHLMKNVQYDPGKDFDLLTVAVQAPNVLVAHPSAPAGSVAELIAALKKTPGQLSFASSGNGSSDHLTVELFWQQTGTSGVHVPYKGGAPAISDLVGGQVPYSFQNINAVIQHIQSGKLKALAITGHQRSPLLPNAPTMAEAGVKNVEVYSWQAVAAPKGLPADVKATLHAALLAALNDPQARKGMTEVGFEIVGNTPEQFSRFQQQEFARWQQVIQAGKISAD
ncbi:tripartite tricarboxylate transporter substrate binding protein [Schlegelella sp. S2-27]|uniref:Tripartite tricarboxylate transporter substrate binding protein n=1 Tax=Caldimonas mangrovi TaxID=2944811 RepID=A0ABT0YK07_9BURK|nr:tripartite tricarboxylate transporter substrate binding protein [Caldimonas mangrovi]MCM5679035.1 tripartite tricarboxylate transporter substrate binding protein [Caldimonas mangrovi]